ncbi:BolA family protein [Methylophaga sp.]|uniref:BolA family protein n=1 Tax=Methylophaga sp. TaxID=2024840 RepID=UPI0013FE572A|nr:BolA family protein [Methylophaga sp.]MTI63704.1 BolA family transcriptional regulator [Methylophaga sp.]
MNTVTAIEKALQTLDPEFVEIEDDSASHAGHAGNTGGGHYNLLIVSEAFHGLSLIQRHKLVYAQVGDLMQRDIHALSIRAKTPAEFHQA